MAIKLLDNAIQVGNFTISEAADGINFTGVLRSTYVGNGMQGTVAGFTSAGDSGGSPRTSINTINRYSFASDSNAVDHGDLVQAVSLTAGTSSTTHGYTAGGYTYNPNAQRNTIQKFPFASTSGSKDVGDMIVEPSGYPPTVSAGISSLVSGYSLGADPSGSQGRAYLSKFPFATDSNSTLVYSETWPSSPTVSRSWGSGHESTENGYATQGGNPNNTGNFIDKFPFATDSPYKDIGNLAQSRWAATGLSSKTDAYIAGGRTSPTVFVNTIEKFPFATDSNSADVGDMSSARNKPSGSQSTTFGYVTGGEIPPSTAVNTIDKFPFATDTNATDIADLAVVHTNGAGHQD